MKNTNVIDREIGQRYGMTTILAYEYMKNSFRYFRCRCDCGKEFISKIWSFKVDKKKSCGCLLIKRRHGLKKHPLYAVWKSMNQRCYDSKMINYQRYGGRGISVCDKWRKFMGFYEDMKDGYESGLSLDRINNDGNYEPSNCRWATLEQQCYNKSNTVLLTINGETKNIKEWARVSGIPEMSIRFRIYNKWNPERAVFTPLRKHIRGNKIPLVSNPIPLSSHLPTFSPNEEYISLLKDLHKETNRSKEVRSEARIGNLRKELIKIEVTLTSEQIIFNTKLAIQEQPKIITKTKYKL